MDPVIPRGDREGAGGDVDIALPRRVIGVRVDAVVSGIDGDVRVLDADGVVGPDPLVRRRDGVGAAGDFQVVSAHDAVGIRGVDREAPAPVEDQIRLAKMTPSRLEERLSFAA